MGMRLLDIYRALSIQAEISNLQKQLGPKIQADMTKTGRMVTEANLASHRIYTRAYQKPAASVPEPARPNISQNYQAKKSEKPQVSPRENILNKKREHAKRNIKKGFYNEAWKDTEEALQIDPNDVESKALKAKIKTLQ
mgnify:CR=1 FL=1